MGEALRATLNEPAIKERISAQGADVVAGSPDQLGTFLKEEIAKWSKVIADNNIKAES
jgi:tripartite-type tricarboxylate transporter receptor subunit TctC